MIGGTELKVGIGDMKFSRGEGRIITYALGSCIGITFYDPVTRLGALLHIMLPAQFEGKDSNPFKFADRHQGNPQKAENIRYDKKPDGS